MPLQGVQGLVPKDIWWHKPENSSVLYLQGTYCVETSNTLPAEAQAVVANGSSQKPFPHFLYLWLSPSPWLPLRLSLFWLSLSLSLSPSRSLSRLSLSLSLCAARCPEPVLLFAGAFHGWRCQAGTSTSGYRGLADLRLEVVLTWTPNVCRIIQNNGLL